jgi:exo-beta-1,3-glucanase (GH17 family)
LLKRAASTVVNSTAGRLIAGLLQCLCLVSLVASPAAAGDAISRVREAIDTLRFVAYTPTDLRIVDGRVHPASKAQIRQDLEKLRDDFQGLVTYSSADGVEAVPAIAAELGYRAVIPGVWDPASESEINTAIGLARNWPELVPAVAVGNETLLAQRHEWPVLRAAMQRVRAALPGVAVTTSEPFYYYLDDTPPDFVASQDFLLPSVHPLFQPWYSRATGTDQAIDFVVKVAALLAEKSSKPVLIKETGLPSGPASEGYTAAGQAQFWTGLCRGLPDTPGLGVVYFEAFDHDWKSENARHEFGLHPEEGYWGLYGGDGRAKPALEQLRRLWREPGAGYCGLRPGSSEESREVTAH